MRRFTRPLAAATLAGFASSAAMAQTGPGFTIEIIEDPRTKREIEVAPEERRPATLELRYAAEKPAPRSSVQAWRQGGRTEFRAWSNYALFAERAEIVVEQAGREIAVLPVQLGTSVRIDRALPEDATYHLRIFDARGRSDRTLSKPISAARTGTPEAGEVLRHARENELSRQRIRLSGRALTADGFGVRPGETVNFEGYPVPVLADGRFADTQIIPAGDRVVDLAVLNRDGRVLTRYAQPVSVADEDFFYVGIADVTIGRNDVAGPIVQVTGEDGDRFAEEIYVNGRLAFYLRGKIRGDWLITAAADTREGPVEDLFDDFLDSDPRAFVRRLDPDRYYPVYGDDSTARLDAPTNGKLYVRLERDGREILWGNFKTRGPGTQFTNHSRSLYGARVRGESAATVGERPRVRGEVYVAEPGTVQAQDEFRGTGGSLYFLRNQDILTGSARVWIETRDRTTGVLIERRELQEFEDYDLNAIQGRISLAAPLGSTVGQAGLLNGATAAGNLQYLVVRYEHNPGFGSDDQTVVGGSAEVAVTERLTFGVNAIEQSNGPNEQTLSGLSMRYTLGENSAIEAEIARSENAGAPLFESIDGGFTFTRRPSGPAARANAGRLAVAFDFRILHGARGNATADRRRAFSLRLVGDDARFVERPGPTSPPFPGHDMQPGQRLREDWFPIIYRA